MGRIRQNRSKKNDPRGRRLSDDELEVIFETLCEHIEDLRDDRNPLLKVCSYNECDEGEDTFTVYLDNAKSVRVTRMHEHIQLFNEQTGNRVEVEAETDEDGGTTWMLYIPLFVPHSKRAQGAAVQRKKRRLQEPDLGELIKWVSIFIGTNVLGQLLEQQTMYQLVRNMLQI